MAFNHDDGLFIATDFRSAALEERAEAIHGAIAELLAGQRVTRLTIAGKSIEYGQADLVALQKLEADTLAELRRYQGLYPSYKCLRASTSKGF
ncbi:hypothetical protein [Desulfatitalea tepidiphila]|uniref:hypothetical protein n=1 Tax=Desulfatitalea tepidiphila TaxID=1185843 RepID=UPI0006B5519F|nr:hypothetical protein [Desulfatitalea tepidiphila]